MKKAIWLSFDLGVKGDYENLFKWLDEREAKECGDNMAYLHFEGKGDVFSEVRDSLYISVKMNDASRFYLIATGEDGKISGSFIIGGRKSPPWTGYDPKKQISSPDAA
jgi:hypothetical protein